MTGNNFFKPFYKRMCRRCGKSFMARGRYTKICDNCILPKHDLNGKTQDRDKSMDAQKKLISMRKRS